MRFLLTFAAICLVATSIGNAKKAQNGQGQGGRPCDAVLVQALSDYSHVKVGAHRKDVEKYFQPSGGLQFPMSARYTYPGSQYLHLDIEYKAAPSVSGPVSPEDTAVSVSKLYVDYEPKD
jgi:hypothetical protein